MSPIFIPGVSSQQRGAPIDSFVSLGAATVLGNTISGAFNISPSSAGFTHWMIFNIDIVINLAAQITSNSNIGFSGAVNGINLSKNFSFNVPNESINWVTGFATFTITCPMPSLPGLLLMPSAGYFLLTNGGVTNFNFNVTLAFNNMTASITSSTLYKRRTG